MTTHSLPTVLPLIGLEGISLLSGGHASREKGVCLLEAVAWVAGESHSDKPQCVCPVLGAFGRRLNDSIRDEAFRTSLLRPPVPMLIGTRSTRAVEQKRAYLATDWAVRVITPQWFDLHDSLKAHAVALRGLAPLESADACKSALSVIREAKKSAAAYAAYAAYAYAAYAAYAYAAYAAYAYAAYAAYAYAAYAAYADAAAAADADADKKAQIVALRDAQFVDAARILREMAAITE